MRPVDAYTVSRFSEATATLCTCWRLRRQDGQEFGFTDHDRDITFTGTVFKAQGGAAGSALEGTADLAPDNSDIIGILSDSALSVEAIDAGLFDEATIEVWRVDWRDPTARLLLKTGSLGSIEREGQGYRAEFRSLKHYLDQTVGRVYGRTCDAVLGDARCGLNLEDPAYKGTATVSEEGVRELVVTGLEGFATDWFTDGTLVVADGPLTGVRRSLRRHEKNGNLVVLSLWEALPTPLSVGTTLTVLAGCDKRFETCRTKFNNVLNFRGFPHIPGNDILTLYPSESDRNEGDGR